MAIAANKVPGVRAAVAWNEDIARLAREHNNANVLSIAARFTPPGEVDKIIWSKKYAKLPLEEQQHYRGWKNWHLWWALFVGIVLAIYAFFIWFRFQHPVRMLPW